MAAPTGNEFWKMRSKHGRDLIFSSPTIMWEACCEYFETTDKRKDWDRQEWVGRDGVEVSRRLRVPYTLTGLYIFLDVSAKAWSEYREREGFGAICTQVENIIYTQKFEGATVGVFNHNIIARDLGLKDKTENDVKAQHSGEIKITLIGDDSIPFANAESEIKE